MIRKNIVPQTKGKAGKGGGPSPGEEKGEKGKSLKIR